MMDISCETILKMFWGILFGPEALLPLKEFKILRTSAGSLGLRKNGL